MRIEKVSENKIKVMFDSTELEENDISVHSFLSNSFESQKLFLAILDIANEEFGFDIQNCKVSCETISFNNKNFVVIVTKLLKSTLKASNSTYNLLDIGNSPKSSQNSENTNNFSFQFEDNTEELIYRFNTMEKVLEFCKYFNTNFFKFDIQNSLYQYKDNFFIIIKFNNQDSNKKDKVASILSEFETNLCLSKLSILKLEEHSKLIIKNNAIKTLEEKY